MRKQASLLGILAGALLAACATEKVGIHSYHNGKCVDCWNNPLTGEPANYQKGEESLTVPSVSSVSAGSSSALALCGQQVKFDLLGAIDVDTAYSRLKREFGYRTRDEVLRARGVNPGADLARTRVLLDTGYQHDAQPGVRYVLSESVTPAFSGNSQRNWLTLELDKNGSGSRVFVSYCDEGTEGFAGGEAFRDQLGKEIASLLSP